MAQNLDELPCVAEGRGGQDADLPDRLFQFLRKPWPELRCGERCKIDCLLSLLAILEIGVVPGEASVPRKMLKLAAPF